MISSNFRWNILHWMNISVNYKKFLLHSICVLFSVLMFWFFMNTIVIKCHTLIQISKMVIVQDLCNVTATATVEEF